VEELGGKGREEGGGKGVGAPFNVLPPGATDLVAPLSLAIVYKSLHGLAPSYLGDDCVLASSDKFRRRLCSVDVDTCIVPRTRIRFGDRSFPDAGPWIWKTGTTELGEFRRLLKTFLFA